VNILCKFVTRRRVDRGSNSRPLSHQPDALATRLSSHRWDVARFLLTSASRGPSASEELLVPIIFNSVIFQSSDIFRVHTKLGGKPSKPVTDGRTGKYHSVEVSRSIRYNKGLFSIEALTSVCILTSTAPL